MKTRRSWMGGSASLLVLAALIAPAAQAADVTLTSATGSPFATDEYPQAVAIGDVNGDGNADLATANSSTRTASTLKGNGAGSFGASSNYATGRNSNAVAVGDFNRDGKADLVTANAGDYKVAVLLSNGDGFATKAEYATGAEPQGVAVGDFNKDAILDIATANADGDSVSVLTGKTDGTFNAKADYTVGDRPVSVAIGDFNKDTFPDIATANASANTVSVLTSNGTGGFNAKSDYATGTRPASVAAGDLDGDSKPDLATANVGADSASVLINNGAGGFKTKVDTTTGKGPNSIAIGDLNRDSKPDLATANLGTGADGTLVNSASVLTGKGDGSFNAKTDFATGRFPLGVAIGDLNGDGRPDLAVANQYGASVSVLLQPRPQAADDTATVSEDSGATTVNVLSNDDSDASEITAVSGSSNSTVAISSDKKSLTYTPVANYCNSTGTTTDNVTYTVRGGAQATLKVTVTCVDDPPVAFDDDATVTEDSSDNEIQVLTNDTDIDGGTKSVYSVTKPDHGVATYDVATEKLTYTPDANYCNTEPGDDPDDFNYRLNGGSKATVYVTVTCVDDAPVAVGDAPTVTEDADATAIDVLSNDTDVDGGTKQVDSISQDPANGTVVKNLDGSGLTYKPKANYCNSQTGGSPDTFKYKLNGGSEATVSVTVTCVDDAPVAVGDTKTVTEDAAATSIDVLANDTDIDSGTKEIASAVDSDNGTVVVASDKKSLTYKPKADYCNSDGTTTDDFKYKLNGGSEATVKVTVTCVDDPPVAVDDTATVAEDAAPTTIQVLDNDTDGDGGTKEVASISSDPGNGRAAVASDSKSVTYVPKAGYCNSDGTTTDDFKYKLNGGSEATVKVTVTCVDDPPVAVGDTKTVTEDAAATSIDVLANDADTDAGTKAIASVTQPGNGTVVKATDGSGLTYEPKANYCNDPGTAPTDDFTYTLNGGSSATVAVTVSCVDDPPVAAADSKTLDQDAPATAVDVLANDTDIDGGPELIDSVVQPAHGAVAIASDGKSLTYKPAAGYCNTRPGSSPETFSYVVNGGSKATVTITVSCAPAVAPSAQQSPSSARDTVAPTITDAKLSATRFTVDAGASASAVTKRGTKLTFRLSEPATVIFVTEQRVGKRWRKVRIFGRRLPAGKTTIDYSGKIKPRGKQRALRAGRYRLRMRPSDRAGNKGKVTRLGFTIVRR